LAYRVGKGGIKIRIRIRKMIKSRSKSRSRIGTVVRFFACGEGLSHEPADAELPEAVGKGEEPFVILGAIAGG